MKERLERLSLASKFSLLLVGVIILTGLAIGAVIVRRSASAYYEERTASLAVAAQMLGIHLEEYMSRLLLDLEQMEQVLAVVQGEDREMLLQSFFSRRSELLAVSYTTAQSTLEKGEWQGQKTVLASFNENDKIFATSHLLSEEPVLTVNASSQLRVQVNLAELSREQKLFDIRLGESGHPYLLDISGMIISHGQEQYVGRFLEDLVTMADGSPGNIDLFTGATFSLLEYTMEGEKRMAGVVPLSELGLVVGFSYSAEELKNHVTFLQRGIWLHSGLLTAIVLILAVFLSSKITGALGCIVKQLEQIENGHTYSIAGRSRSPEISMVQGSVNKLVSTLHENSRAAVTTLVLALEARDRDTKGHSQKVARIATQIAEAMGYERREIALVSRAALLHDLGKIAVPDRILLKETSLSSEERAIICQHPGVAKKMLSPLPFLREESIIIEQHHERPDGLGYPYGLKSEEIHPLAKVLAVADAFEAMTANRPYRRALTVSEAFSRLCRGKDSQFDKDVVDAFLLLVEKRMFQGEDVLELSNEGA